MKNDKLSLVAVLVGVGEGISACFVRRDEKKYFSLPSKTSRLDAMRRKTRGNKEMRK